MRVIYEIVEDEVFCELVLNEEEIESILDGQISLGKLVIKNKVWNFGVIQAQDEDDATSEEQE